MPRADEDQAAVAVGDERHPPQNEGTHEDLAELEVSLHERAQMLTIDDDDRPVAESPPADDGAARGQHVDLAREFAGAVHHDRLFTTVDRAHDLDGALDDHEEAGVLLPELEQHLARADAATLADRGDPFDLSRGQPGEHLVATAQVRVCHDVAGRAGLPGGGLLGHDTPEVREPDCIRARTLAQPCGVIAQANRGAEKRRISRARSASGALDTAKLGEHVRIVRLEPVAEAPPYKLRGGRPRSRP